MYLLRPIYTRPHDEQDRHGCTLWMPDVEQASKQYSREWGLVNMRIPWRGNRVFEERKGSKCGGA